MVIFLSYINVYQRVYQMISLLYLHSRLMEPHQSGFLDTGARCFRRSVLVVDMMGMGMGM
jgi:hypothetical protein